MSFARARPALAEADDAVASIARMADGTADGTEEGPGPILPAAGYETPRVPMAAHGPETDMALAVPLAHTLRIPDSVIDAPLLIRGGDTESTTEELSGTPEPLFTRLSQEVTVEGSLLAPMMVGKLLRWHGAVVHICKPVVPTGGGGGSATPHQDIDLVALVTQFRSTSEEEV